MKKGITNLTEKRLAQLKPDVVYVSYLNIPDEYENPGTVGWSWGYDQENTELFSHADVTELAYISDPDLTDDELKSLVREQVDEDAEVVIDRTNAPKFSPLQFDSEDW